MSLALGCTNLMSDFLCTWSYKTTCATPYMRLIQLPVVWECSIGMPKLDGRLPVHQDHQNLCALPSWVEHGGFWQVPTTHSKAWYKLVTKLFHTIWDMWDNFLACLLHYHALNWVACVASYYLRHDQLVNHVLDWMRVGGLTAKHCALWNTYPKPARIYRNYKSWSQTIQHHKMPARERFMTESLRC